VKDKHKVIVAILLTYLLISLMPSIGLLALLSKRKKNG
jgi:hypothetical protein